MPKIVDHDARRASIGRAAAKLIEREGIQAASVRSVASEAGLEPSTLRHYFPSSDKMLAYTVSMVRDDQSSRLSAEIPLGDNRSLVREAWLQALPLDKTRRTEAHVWLAVTAVARSIALRDVLRDINSGLAHLSEVTVRIYAPQSDVVTEARALRAFTDGLTINAITEPEVYTSAILEQALDKYLDRLISLTPETSLR